MCQINGMEIDLLCELVEHRCVVRRRRERYGDELHCARSLVTGINEEVCFNIVPPLFVKPRPSSASLQDARKVADIEGQDSSQARYFRNALLSYEKFPRGEG